MVQIRHHAIDVPARDRRVEDGVAGSVCNNMDNMILANIEGPRYYYNIGL